MSEKQRLALIEGKVAAALKSVGFRVETAPCPCKHHPTFRAVVKDDKDAASETASVIAYVATETGCTGVQGLCTEMTKYEDRRKPLVTTDYQLY